MKQDLLFMGSEPVRSQAVIISAAAVVNKKGDLVARCNSREEALRVAESLNLHTQSGNFEVAKG